jgi:hypothetical protein
LIPRTGDPHISWYWRVYRSEENMMSIRHILIDSQACSTTDGSQADHST